ncbi:MAG: hypothetical protein KJ556_20860 [Gammaproteobacteria bacterium]|nr:hypothetical protein [Gammaproteobacteria bacterium]
MDVEERDLTPDSLTPLKCDHSPIQITFDTSSDCIFAPINGSRAVIKMIAITNFQFSNLYTADVRKYRVSLYISADDSSGVGELEWRGFLHPEQRSTVYNQAPNMNTFIASDQLGYLKTLDWDRETPETELSALGTILNKTGLDFDLYEAINVYEKEHNSTVADSPLDQTYFNPKVFDGMSYYDALHQLLFKYKAVIKQDRGVWTIYRPEDMQTSFVRRYYTFSSGVFTYDSNDSFDPIVFTTSATTEFENLVRIENSSPMANTSPAWNKYELVQNYSRIENILENGNFSEWADNRPVGWKVQGVGQMKFYQESEGIKIMGTGTLFREFRNVYQLVEDVDHDWLTISVDYNVFVKKGESLLVEIAVTRFSGPSGRRGEGGTGYLLWWDFDNNWWTSNESKYQEPHDNSAGDRGIYQGGGFEFTTTWSAYQGTKKIGIILYAPYDSEAGEGNDSGSFVVFKEANIHLVKATDIVPGSGVAATTENYKDEDVHDVELNTNNTTDGGSFEMLLNDLPELDAHANFVYYGGLWRDNLLTCPTEEWTDSTGVGKLVELLKRGFAWYYLNPTEILKVSIISRLINSTSVIQEINNDNKLYMIKKATWDVRYCRWTVEAYEIGVGTGPAIVTESDEYIDIGDGRVLGI